DAVALLRGHQPEGRFPSQAEDDEARAIAQLLKGFTLAVETAAIYLGRHPGEDACLVFRGRLIKAGLVPGGKVAEEDPAVAVRHPERSLGKTLAITFETLSPETLHLLTLASLLPADAIALPWLEAVAARPATRDGATVSTSTSRVTTDLLLSLRLLQPTDV